MNDITRIAAARARYVPQAVQTTFSAQQCINCARTYNITSMTTTNARGTP